MRSIFVCLLVITLLIPGVAIAQDALPYLAVGASPCQFDFDFQSYGTIWKFTSVGSESQRVVMYAYFDGEPERIYNQVLVSGDGKYLEEWNISTVPDYYLVQTYDMNNYLTGESFYEVPHFISRLWIPKIEGVYVAS